MSANDGNLEKITLAVIVRDDAAGLRATLESAAAAADEIVVVDTGSRDASAKTASQCGAIVHHFPWSDDFSAPRNLAMQQASHPWVFWLDSGETIAEEECQAIRQFAAASDPRKTAGMILVRLPCEPGALAGEQVGRIRLVSQQARFQGRLRENCDAWLEANKIEALGLPVAAVRPVRELDDDRKTARAKRNLRLAQLEIEERGERPHLLNCIAEAHQILGDAGRSREFYGKALKTAEPGSAAMLEAYYGILTVLDGSLHQAELQQQTCLAGLEHFPVDAQLLTALGGYLQRQGQLELCVRAHRTAYDHGQVHPEVWHLDGIREIAATCTAVGLVQLKKKEEALAFLASVLAAHPEFSRARQQLVDMALEAGRLERAQDAWQQERAHVDSITAGNVIAGASLAMKKNWGEALPKLQAAYNAGCRESLCLRWLVVSLLGDGDTVGARKMLEQWLARDPYDSVAQAILQQWDATAQAAKAQRRNDGPQLPSGPQAVAGVRKKDWV